MAWQDRLKPSIVLTAPSGKVFEALWQGSPRTREKKLGIFTFPKFNGAVIQDLGTTGTRYPMALNFVGEDNDLVAQEFFDALLERGLWQVVHPVHGDLLLQPISFTPNDDPTASGNITVVQTEWIDPIEAATIPAPEEIQAEAAAQVDELNEVAAGELDANVSQVTASEVSAFRQAINNSVAAISNAVAGLVAFSAAVSAEIAAIQRDIASILAVVPGDIIAAAAQVQQLAELPARIEADLESRIDAYDNMIDDLISGGDDGIPSFAFRNRVAARETSLVAAFTAIAIITTTSTPQSRQQALELIERNVAISNKIVVALDAEQERFKDEPIDVQYFSQSQSFASMQRLLSLAIKYQLRASFDLAIEKRIVLDRPRAPIEITITEYGSMGENDSNFDLFIESNDLSGDEIIMLPTGREVVVYV